MVVPFTVSSKTSTKTSQRICVHGCHRAAVPASAQYLPTPTTNKGERCTGVICLYDTRHTQMGMGPMRVGAVVARPHGMYITHRSRACCASNAPTRMCPVRRSLSVAPRDRARATAAQRTGGAVRYSATAAAAEAADAPLAREYDAQFGIPGSLTVEEGDGGLTKVVRAHVPLPLHATSALFSLLNRP